MNALMGSILIIYDNLINNETDWYKKQTLGAEQNRTYRFITIRKWTYVPLLYSHVILMIIWYKLYMYDNVITIPLNDNFILMKVNHWNVTVKRILENPLKTMLDFFGNRYIQHSLVFTFILATNDCLFFSSYLGYSDNLCIHMFTCKSYRRIRSLKLCNIPVSAYGTLFVRNIKHLTKLFSSDLKLLSLRYFNTHLLFLLMLFYPSQFLSLHQ
jgi:hypothetical protein